MPVSEGYLEFVLERLSQVGRVTAKRMFGGAGIYLGEVFFALIADDVLYFKVNDENKPDYEAASMEPFRPRKGKPYVMSYYQVPIDVLEDDARLREWAGKSLAAARAGPRRRRAS